MPVTRSYVDCLGEAQDHYLGNPLGLLANALSMSGERLRPTERFLIFAPVFFRPLLRHGSLYD